VLQDLEGKKLFIERLSNGRLQLFEYKYYGRENGISGITSDYYIKDTRDEGKSAELKDLRKIRKKFYKKILKPYMEDQPMIWSDLDKFEF
jgi:hypothetical protein